MHWWENFTSIIVNFDGKRVFLNAFSVTWQSRLNMDLNTQEDVDCSSSVLKYNIKVLVTRWSYAQITHRGRCLVRHVLVTFCFPSMTVTLLIIHLVGSKKFLQVKNIRKTYFFLLIQIFSFKMSSILILF